MSRGSGCCLLQSNREFSKFLECAERLIVLASIQLLACALADRPLLDRPSTRGKITAGFVRPIRAHVRGRFLPD